MKLGHVNDHTVQYILETLPSAIKKSLDERLNAHQDEQIPSKLVHDALYQEIMGLDQTIVSGFARIFDDERLSAGNRSTQSASKTVINDRSQNDGLYDTIARALGGCTALIVLISAKKDEFWLANLGDSFAGMCHFVTIHSRFRLNVY